MTDNTKCWCGELIDEDRLSVGFDTCIQHAGQKKHVGYMDYSHKTAPEIVIIPNTSGNQESLRRAQRVNERGR